MENYKVEGFGFDGKNQIVPKSFITDDPRKLSRKLGIDKVSKLDTGDVIFDREVVGIVNFSRWWEENITPPPPESSGSVQSINAIETPPELYLLQCNHSLCSSGGYPLSPSGVELNFHKDCSLYSAKHIL